MADLASRFPAGIEYAVVYDTTTFVKLTIDDFTKIGRRVPVLADLKPSGKYLMSELVSIGGIVPLMKELLGAKLTALAVASDAVEPVTTALGSGASGISGRTAYVLQEEVTPSSFAAALVHGSRQGVDRLVLYADRGAPLAARLQQWFEPVKESSAPTVEVTSPRDFFMLSMPRVTTPRFEQ